MMFDIMFTLIVIMLLMNMVFGIIIDTFNELREEIQEKGNFYPPLHNNLFN